MGLIALAVAMGIGRFAFTPILPMMQDAGLSLTAGGWLASANYLGYLLGALSAMALRAHPVVIIRGGLLTIAAVTFAMGLTHDFALWVALRTIAGIASAWVLVFVSSWCLEELTALKRAELGGIVFTGVGSGIAIAGAVCLVLMNLGVTADHAWMVFGIASLLLVLLIWLPLQLPTHAMTHHTAARTPFRWTNTSVRLTLAYAAFGFGYIIPATFLPAMAKQVVADPLVFGWSWPIFGAAAVVSTLAAGVLTKFTRNRTLWLTGQMLMAVGVALPALWSHIVALLLAGILVGGTFMVVTMVAIQEARLVGGAQATRLVAAMTTGFALGQIVGPIVASYAVDATGNYAVALYGACFLLILGALWLPHDSLAKRQTVDA